MRELRIGLFLGLRQIQKANAWATVLIVVIVLFTFLNLVTLSGILIGIVDGATNEIRQQALSDVVITPLGDNVEIEESYKLISELKNFDEIEAFSPRYIESAVIEANYKERRDLSEDPDIIVNNIIGLNVEAEKQTTDLSTLVVEGSFLKEDEIGYVVLGKHNVDRYADEYETVFDSLKNIYPGSKVLITSGAQTREFTVKGIIASKVDMVSIGVYMTELDFRRMFNRVNHNVNQIVVKISPGYTGVVVRDRLRNAGLSELAEINDFEEVEPKFVVDVRNTFTLLGLIVGITGIIVASITIFIIIFINALSRRQQIGILKAVGITRKTIEYAYITQAFIYAAVGSTLGILITQFILVPYLLQNPIDFPFSDVSLSVSLTGMIYKGIVLTAVACIAGFVPVWIIARKNTLDSILGRK